MHIDNTVGQAYFSQVNSKENDKLTTVIEGDVTQSVIDVFCGCVAPRTTIQASNESQKIWLHELTSKESMKTYV